MKYLVQVVQFTFCFLLCWLLDQQLSLFLSYFVPGQWNLVVHISLLYLLFASVFYRKETLLIGSLICGFLLDSYLFRSIGFLLVFLPLCSLILTRFNRLFLRNSGTIVLSAALFLAFFEALFFVVSGWMGLAGLNWIDFAVFSYAPTLVLNGGLTLLALPLFRFFLARSE